MLQQDNLCFVQFLHPGVEHQPDSGGKKAWNKGPHRRKFLLSPGHAVTGNATTEGDLTFWGEWEPESEVVEEFRDGLVGGPEHLWRPYYVVPQSYQGHQNTDPFVFGTFLYGICQQFRKTGPTKLRYLDRGSVILFGSCLADEFVLDTVFVVRDWADHKLQTYTSALAGRVPQEYIDVCVRPLYASDGKVEDGCVPNQAQSWRLYIGATHDNPLEGMYSFFPCLPRSGAKRSFCRPAIRDGEFVTGSSRQGFRLNPQVSVRDCTRLWQEVVEQVLSAGLWMGVNAEMPARRGAAVEYEE